MEDEYMSSLEEGIGYTHRLPVNTATLGLAKTSVTSMAEVN